MWGLEAWPDTLQSAIAKLKLSSVMPRQRQNEAALQALQDRVARLEAENASLKETAASLRAENASLKQAADSSQREIASSNLPVRSIQCPKCLRLDVVSGTQVDTKHCM